MPNRTSLFQAYKAPIAVLLALALALGTAAYRRINVVLFPEVTFPKVKVIADNGLVPVDRMMVTVTKPMEDAMKRVPGLKLLRSTTSRGSCEISAFLDWNVDVAKSQSLIESRLNQIRADLPATAQISVERMNPAILPVMGYTLEAPASRRWSCASWRCSPSSRFCRRWRAFRRSRFRAGAPRSTRCSCCPTSWPRWA